MHGAVKSTLKFSSVDLTLITLLEFLCKSRKFNLPCDLGANTMELGVFPTERC